MSADTRFMAEAVRLGEAARGRSAPNPNVGCVIVSAKGDIVGRGATAAGGRPHAEAVALNRAGKNATGSTVYVSVQLPNADGKLQSWLNGVQQVNLTDYVFRERSDVHISHLMWSVFRGGSTMDWAGAWDSYIDFDNVRITTTD